MKWDTTMLNCKIRTKWFLKKETMKSTIQNPKQKLPHAMLNQITRY